MLEIGPLHTTGGLNIEGEADSYDFGVGEPQVSCANRMIFAAFFIDYPIQTQGAM